MNKSRKIVIALKVVLICFIGWLVYTNSSGNLKLSASNVAEQPDSGELCYMRGCDDLSFIGIYRKSFKSDDKALAEMEKHNDLAEQNFSKAIELIPDCANAYWKRGRCKRNRWRWLGNPHDNSAAIADYKKAIELVPTSTEVRYSLLKAYLSSGKSELAKEEFEKMIKLDPDWRSRKGLEDEMQKYDQP